MIMIWWTNLFLIVLCLLSTRSAYAFTRVTHTHASNSFYRRIISGDYDDNHDSGNLFLLYDKAQSAVEDPVVASESEADTGVTEKNPFVKASWYAVETFGQIFGRGRSGQKNVEEDVEVEEASSSVVVDLNRAPISLEEALERIEMDNARSYFLSGEVDVEAYSESCVFADPFVSFEGRQRFVDNLANLGSFITKFDAKFLGYDVDKNKDDSSSDDIQAAIAAKVKTKVMVKLELNLPWKPVLAWPWGVTYIIRESSSETGKSYLITEHIESWDIEPVEGVKQIFRKPTVSIK